jgi:hypothetical protein
MSDEAGKTIDSAEAPFEIPQRAAVGAADDTYLAKQMMEGPNLNGVVLRKYANEELLRWAAEFCRIGEPVRAQFCYYEGKAALPGESFGQQLQRQLEEDFQECGESLLTQGLAKQSAGLASSPTAVKALRILLQQLMQLYDSCTEPGCDDMRWKIKMEANQDGACTKYHDDLVDVRFAMSLAGEGTVLADNSGVDWDYYDSCDGYLPESADDADLSTAIQAFNQRVTQSELTTAPGDLTILKGGKQTPFPCLHRAPYMAGDGLQVARFLITVDRYCQDDLDQIAEIDIGHVENISNTDKRNIETQALPATNEISQNKKRSGNTSKTTTPRRSVRGKGATQLPSEAKRARRR